MTVEAGVLSIRVEQTGADKVAGDLGLLDRQLKELGKQVNLFQEGLKYAGTRTQSLRELASVEQQLKGVVSSVNTSLEQRIIAEKQLAQIHAPAISRTQSMIDTVAKLALQYVGLRLVMKELEVVAGALREQINLGDKLHDMSIQTGVSVETLSILQPVAEKANGSLEGLARGFRNMEKATESALAGDKKAVTAFRDIGISVEDLKGKTPEQVLQMVATGLEKITDASRKSTDAQAIFGRGGDQLLSMLHDLAGDGFDKAAEAARRFGGVISEEFADKADAYNDKLRDIKTQLGGIARAFANNMLDWMNPFLERFSKILEVVRAGMVMRGIIKPLDEDPGLNAAIRAMNEQIAKKKEPPRARGGDDPDAARKVDEEVARTLERTRKAAGMGRDDITSGAAASTDIPFDAQLARAAGAKPADKLKGVKGDPAKLLADAILGTDPAIQAQIKAKKELIQGLLQTVAGSIGQAFGDAFTAAFSGDDNFFAALGKGLLRSLGNMIMQLGESMIEYAASVALLAAIPGPWQALGWGAPLTAAAGLGLVALGAGMGALAGKGGHKGSHGGGGGGRGGSSSTGDNAFAVQFDPDHKFRQSKGPSVIPGVRGIDNTPMPDGRPMVYIGHLSALHPDDPTWQRNVSDTVYRAGRRGVRGG